MKTVWVVERHVPYEFEEIYGIFSSKEKAEIALENFYNLCSLGKDWYDGEMYIHSYYLDEEIKGENE